MPSFQVLSLLSGNFWTPTGQRADITYSIKGTTFLDIDPDFSSAVRNAVDAWNRVADINMVYIAPSVSNVTTSDITFDFTTVDPPAIGLATSTFVGETITHVDVDISDLYFSVKNFGSGTEGFVTIMHEIGHALGLSHPDDTSSAFSFSYTSTLDDSIMNSVSGVFGTGTTVSGYPVGPQVEDIAAMQHLYGANTVFNLGDTVYTFTTVAQTRTIWDAGGIDTISNKNGTTAVTINLRESSEEITQFGNARIWNAIGSHIENATGGVVNDTIIGNSMDNTIKGGSGNDTITSDPGNDNVNGNMGNDTINGNAGADFLRGGRDNDTVHGGRDNDTIYGDLGNDFIYGDKQNDILYGGTGNDTFVFNDESGVDSIQDFEGAGAAVADVIQIASSVIATTTAALAATTFSGGNASINLGLGNTVTLIGVTAMDITDFTIV